MTTKESPRSVEDTVARLKGVLDSKGIKLFAVIDHSGEAKAAGLELRDTKLVIFGSPVAGTPVMAAAPLAALDLPLKVLVWAQARRDRRRDRCGDRGMNPRDSAWPTHTATVTAELRRARRRRQRERNS
jgi:uncharacterized protein (DUF302 family)